MIVVTPAGTVELGAVEATPTIGIIDRSRRMTDAFGVTTVVERGFSRRMSVRLAVPSDAVDGVQRTLADLRAGEATWIADARFQSLTVRGFYKDFSIDMPGAAISYCTLTVEGLTVTEPIADTGADPAPEGKASTLRLLDPIVMTDAALVSASVPESDHPEWAAGTGYGKGARVIKAATHRVYESAVDGNAGNDPAGDSGKWLDVGPTNRWAAFDQALGTATTSSDQIVYTIDGAINAVALLDVSADAVRVTADGYDRTQPAGPGAVTFLDLPAGTTRVTVALTGGQVAVGTLLAGRLVGLGVTEASPTAGIIDYSRKDTNDFGDTTVVERAWAKRMSVRGLIRTAAIDDVVARLAAVRARPVLWLGREGQDSLTVYGFYKDFSIEAGQTVSKVSLSIEGLSKSTTATPYDLGTDWPDVRDPDGTKPADNADVTAENTAKDTAAVGGKPSGEVIQQLSDFDRAIAAAKARQDRLETETIPAINRAVVDAGERITVVRQDAEKASAETNARIDAADRVIDGAVRDLAAEVDRAQGADEQLTRRVDAIVVDAGNDGREVRTLISSEATVRADDDRALGRRVDTVSASVKEGDDAVRADVKVTTDALARADVAFAEQARSIEASLGTVDNRIAAKAQEVTSAYADADRALGRRIDAIVAEGGYDDRSVRAEIKRVDETSVERDAAVGRRVDTVSADFKTADDAVRADVKTTTDALARQDVAFADQVRNINANLGTVDARIGASANEVTRVFTSADQALSNRSTVLEAAASSISTGAVRNDNFNLWADGRAHPDRWDLWQNNGNYRTARLAQSRAGGQFCIQTLNDSVDVNSGFGQTVLTGVAGKWVIEVVAEFDQSGARGAGVTLSGVNGWQIDFCSDADTVDYRGDRAGVVRAWSKMVDLDARNAITVHAMHGWLGFGRGVAPKYMIWHRVNLRPATDGEIKAGKADASLNAPGGVLAKMSSYDATLADLPNRYAAVQSVQTLEAQVNFSADSGLQRTLRAVVEDRATAIADSKAGAVAETVRILRGEYNGTVGEVRDQRGVINGLNGKTAAYVKVVADAGGGVAALSLWSDQYGGAWELAGDGRIRGRLLVDGEITTLKIAPGAVTGALAIGGADARVNPGEQVDNARGTINVGPGAAVRLEFKLFSNYFLQAGQGSQICYASIIRIVNGAETEVLTMGLPRGQNATNWTIDFPPEGSVQYVLRFKDYQGSGGAYYWQMSQILLGIIGWKR